MRYPTVVLTALAGMFAAFVLVSQAKAAELVIWTSQGSVPNVREVTEAFARASGHKVTIIQVGSSGIARKLASGEQADVLVIGHEEMDEWANKGTVVAGTSKPWITVGLGISVRAGAPKPDVSTVEAYKAALLAAKSIGYSFGCSGLNIAKGIDELGLTEQLKAKTVRTGSQAGGGPVTEHLAKGDFELGIQQPNIMIGAAGTDYVGPVPDALDKRCTTNLGLMAVSKQQDAARALIQFMLSPEAAPLLRKTHVEPAKS
jgi:molybdate transport system substrate-binding protein